MTNGLADSVYRGRVSAAETTVFVGLIRIAPSNWSGHCRDVIHAPLRLRPANVISFLALSALAFVPLYAAAEPTNPPKRPDFSALTPAQAEKANADYKAALMEWERIEEPRRKAAIEEAIKIQEVRKEQRADPTWKPAPITNLASLGSDYNWESDAQSEDLDEPTRALLRRDHLAITDKSFRQSFSVYMDPAYVPFVTSDSLLNGFHVLLEATLRRYELRRAQRLRTTLEFVWNGLEQRLAEEKVSRSAVEPYARHLALVIGPALRLLGSNIRLGDSVVEAEVDVTVKKITEANAAGLPDWLAPAEPTLTGIDFRRCRPLGFYADTPMLADYYRAVRWLQLVPLRASRSNEAGAAALLADLSFAAGSDGLEEFVKDGALIWGKTEDLDLVTFQGRSRDFIAQIAKAGSADSAVDTAIKDIRSLAGWHHSKVNDRIRARPDQAGDARDAAVIILVPSVLPDSTFLEEIAASRPSDRPLPQGLEIAAWLGSDFALSVLPPAVAEKISKDRAAVEADYWDQPYWGSQIPDFYYYTLQSLFRPADAAAPEFMKSTAWQRKSLQTALAGWAQLRHAWELQTKLNVSFACGHTRPAGLVEPNPEFFRRMNTLISVMIARFQEAQVFSKVPQDEVDFIRGWLRLIDRYGLRKVDLDWREITGEEGDCLIDMALAATKMVSSFPGITELENYRGEQQRGYWTRVYEALNTRIAALERGEKLPALDCRQFHLDPDQNMFRRWQALQTMTVRFEAMVQKQLRGADWNKDEAEVIKNYAELLGEVMGYFSSATMMPEDDAPRWTSVHHDLASDNQLAVAIGRAKALYVLYPWHGTPVLCRGAVMPYYEYRAPARLTDSEWKSVLDSPQAPQQPEWIQPILSPARGR